MSIESEIKDILESSDDITDIVDDRIYAKEDLGQDGLTRSANPEIFTGGILQPTIMIRERDLVADGQINDPNDKDTSALQIVEIYIYQEEGYGQIDLLRKLIRDLLRGEFVSDSFEMEWILENPRLQDEASLAGASLARQDWSVNVIV